MQKQELLALQIVQADLSYVIVEKQTAVTGGLWRLHSMHNSSTLVIRVITYTSGGA